MGTLKALCCYFSCVTHYECYLPGDGGLGGRTFIFISILSELSQLWGRHLDCWQRYSPSSFSVALIISSLSTFLQYSPVSFNCVILYFPSVFNVLFLKRQANALHPFSACSLTKQPIVMFSKAFLSTCEVPFTFIFLVGPAWKKILLIFNYERFNSLRNCGVVALGNWNKLRFSPQKKTTDFSSVSPSLGRQLQPSSTSLIVRNLLSIWYWRMSACVNCVFFFTLVLCLTFIISTANSGCQRCVYVWLLSGRSPTAKTVDIDFPICVGI